MTKSELIDKIHNKLPDILTKKDAELIVNTIFNDMSKALHKGDRIEIRGFATFKIIDRKAKAGRNPKTGEDVDVPAKKAIFFKPGKELKERVDY